MATPPSQPTLTATNCPRVWAGYFQAVLDGLNVGRAVLLGGMIIDDYIYYKGTDQVAAVVYTGSVHRFDVGSSQVSEEFLSVALSLTDQNLSVRIRATRDLSRLLTMASLPAEQLSEIAMYNILVEREAIQGLFGYINGEKPPGYDETVLKELSSLPVLLVHGQDDAVIPSNVAEACSDIIKEAGALMLGW